MAASRSESQQPSAYGRKRSNTVTSVLKSTIPPSATPVVPAIPLRTGDSKVLTTWVHDTKDSPSVILNQTWWPGVQEGDLLQLCAQPPEQGSGHKILFQVPKPDESIKHQLQVSIPRPMAEKLGLRNNGEVLLTKVDKDACSAEYVELTFQDQYLGRNEMWRMGQHLVGQCVYVDEEISFIGLVSARVHSIYIGGKKVSTACMTSRTKLVYRSLSSRATIFIQVCRELWEFAGDGERYYEKVVHSFLPALFMKWREAGTMNIVTIVLISRVFYDESEIEYAAGPLRQDDDGRRYKDFFKVITDLEVLYDWKPTLVSLKDSFWAFQRDILLAHHYHRASLSSSDTRSQIHLGAAEDDESVASSVEADNVRLVGTISYAHDGPLLEALNLSFNPLETHYIDRSLALTGSTTIVITPGTGYFRVNKQLLRLTTTRLLDQGFALDLVSLTKPPLHQSPIFVFKGYEPEFTGNGMGTGSRTLDALWSADEEHSESATNRKMDDEKKEGNTDRKMTTFWWEPFWMSISFWDRQMDLPFREDRFVARAKMHEIEMLGLLDHDVLSSIELPSLPDPAIDPNATPMPKSMYASMSTVSTENSNATTGARRLTKVEADRFDNDVFLYYQFPPPNLSLSMVPQMNRGSIASFSSAASTASFRTEGGGGGGGLKRSLSSRGAESSRFATIQESPRRDSIGLPVPSGSRNDPDGEKHLSTAFSPTSDTKILSTSPSQASILSVRTARSTSSTLSAATSSTRVGSTRSGSSRPTQKGGISTSSRFTPSWFWNTFSRSGISEPETSTVSAAGGVLAPSTPSPISAQPIASSSKVAIQGRVRGQSQSKIQTPVHGHQAQSSAQPFAHRSPKPVAIKSATVGRTGLSRASTMEEDGLTTPHRGSLTRHSPLANTPPRDLESIFPGVKRRSGTLSSIMPPLASSSSPVVARTNPSRPGPPAPSTTQSALSRRWEHMFPTPLSKHDIKWRAMLTPGCLPLTTEYFPRPSELEHAYIVSPYDFVVDPPEMRSFLVRAPQVSPNVNSNNPEIVRRVWALAVMRAMVALRLAQGFQFILRPSASARESENSVQPLRRTASTYADTDSDGPKPDGASEVLKTVNDPVYLSMSNEIHRIAYVGDSIQVRRYVKKVPRTKPYEYQCLIWPKLGVGYTELRTSFVPHGLENYSWNRLDMLVSGYETQSNESLRYWRTRFVIIPTDEPPLANVGPLGEKLNEEEIRLLGMDKLAELFSKVRWLSPDERGKQHHLVHFIPTDLGPTQCVLDENLVSQLDEIHAAGPLKKKLKSERDISEMSLQAIAKAMREEDGIPMKDRRWHGKTYPSCFTGADLVSWLIREFRDVPTREQATEWGAKLQDQGLFEHCRGAHGFLDGHYFYALRGEYLVPMTPRSGWFGRSTRHVSADETNSRPGMGPSHNKSGVGKRTRKKLILSQSMVIDIDPNKKSDQAECVVLHHDIIHNPATCFHFELQWIGTTARCIDEILRQWSRTIERYGLKLVEAYVSQISDIRDRNPFQSCFPLPLALAPPVVPDLERRVPEGTQTMHYFESALLKKMGFVLDIEAGCAYPDSIDVVYSYRRQPFKYSQWVHRSGVAFVQVLGGADGFLFLTNRLIAPGKIGAALKLQKPGTAAEELRQRLQEFFSDRDALGQFYDNELAQLDSVTHMDEPPPLKI